MTGAEMYAAHLKLKGADGPEWIDLSKKEQDAWNFTAAVYPPAQVQHIERTFADGKYTLIREEGGRMHALRYGQPWRELSGDNLIFYMLMRIVYLEEQLEGWES